MGNFLNFRFRFRALDVSMNLQSILDCSFPKFQHWYNSANKILLCYKTAELNHNIYGFFLPLLIAFCALAFFDPIFFNNNADENF